MALDFPTGPTVGDTYGRWVWNGVSWVSAPTVSAAYLPLTGGTLTGNLVVDADAGVTGDLAVDGGITTDHLTTTGTSLDVAGSATIGGTLTVDGDTEFKADVTINGNDVATEDWTMQQVAAGGLWQGTWDAENNVPDLTQTAVQFDGYTWAVVLSDPTASFTIPATPVIPGLNGAVVWTGYHVIWSTSAAEFQIVPGGGMSLTQAQDLFLAKTGGALTAPGNLSTPGAIAATGAITATGQMNANGGLVVGSAFHASGSVFNANIGGSVFITSNLGIQIGGNDGLWLQDPVMLNGSRFRILGSILHLDNSNTSSDLDIRNNNYKVNVDGRPLATEQFVLANAVTAAPGLPTTGGTLQGPGNLTVSGTLQVNNYTNLNMGLYVQQNLQAAGTYFNANQDGSIYLQGGWYGPPNYLQQMYVDLNMDVAGKLRVLGYYGNSGIEISPRGYGPNGYLSVGDVTNPNVWQRNGCLFEAGSAWMFYSIPQFYNGIHVQGDIWTNNSYLKTGAGSYGIHFMDYGGSEIVATLRTTYGPTGGIGPTSGIEAHASTFTVYGSTLKPGGGVWGTLSDARTKTDVHDYTSGLAELTKLEPITYRYNGRARMPEDGKTYIGLKAEEAADVMPEMVRKVRGKLEYDDDGETDILHLDSTALAFATINALKEITKRLEALEAKLK